MRCAPFVSAAVVAAQRRNAASTVTRDPRFKTLSQDDISYFKSLFNSDEDKSSCVLSARSSAAASTAAGAEEDLSLYNEDWMGHFRGNSQLVLRPKTTEQVSKILEYCNAQKLAVVPQGGNTGLVGGSVPVFDEIIVSTSLMNKIESFDEKSGTLVAQSGCILENLMQFLEKQGYLMPLDLGAKGSCHIGGNVATNAGGLRYLRYRSLHANVLGVEAVLPDGRILDLVKTIRKDNTGLHLTQLMVGSEGMLGLITKVAIACPVLPKSVNVVLLGVPSFEATQQIFRTAKQQLGEILSAFEFFDAKCLDVVVKHAQPQSAQQRKPLEGDHPFYVLLETHGSNTEHDSSKLETFFDTVLGQGLASDGTLGLDETKSKELWKFRESIPESIKHEGPVYKYDISIPLPRMYSIVEEMRDKLTAREPRVQVFGYGHLGDDNLHLNVIVPRDLQDQTVPQIEPFVYEWTSANNGSISAEHGIGFMKARYLKYSKSPVAIDMMKAIKQQFDPNGILNPYKMY